MTGFASRLKSRLVIHEKNANGELQPVDFLSNEDIRPVKIQDRTWTFSTYLIFWFSAIATVSNWYVASVGLSVGLSVWESIGCMFGGQILAGILVAFNGRAGAVYRIGYPVFARASFGVYGAWWPAFNRVIMAIVWNGVNMVQGGQCVYVMLHAIFPSIARMKNTMGPGSALSSAQMICFAVFWIVVCAFLVIPIPKMRGLVYAKLVVFVCSAIAMLAWTLTLAGGIGPVVTQGSTIHGTEKSWMLAKFFWLGLASYGTFISNAADFQRYARRPNDTIAGQVISFPLANLVVMLVGTIIAASSQIIFGELVWNPLDVLNRLMEGEKYTPGNRAGCFFISLAFVYSGIFSSIFENFIPAGNDIAALLPKCLNIKRAFFVCAVVSIAICPWYLLASASVFINFLSSYQIFLSAIGGILICDYYVINRGDLVISALYTRDPTEPYHFLHGFNLRAFAAYIVAVAPNFYGFLNALGVPAPAGVERFYYVAYPVGFLIAFFVYWGLCLAFPPQKMNDWRVWSEPRDYVDEHDPSGPLQGQSCQSMSMGDSEVRRVLVTGKSSSEKA